MIIRPSIEFAQRYFNGKVNIIVEIGTGNASNAIKMYNALNPKQIYLIDPFCPPDNWPEADKEYCRVEGAFNKIKVGEICKGYNNWTLIPKESHFAVDDVPNELDLVYIDAIHDEFNVTRDIECWLPKIRTGGILCGHDYYCSEVKIAVDKKYPDIRGRAAIGCYDKDRHSNAEGSDWWIVKE